MTATRMPRGTIVHGYLAGTQDHWFPWLAERLAAAGVTARIAELPDSRHPDPRRWAAVMAELLPDPDVDDVVIAHSLGCLTVLRHLASLGTPWRLDALVLVAGFTAPLPVLPELDGFIGSGVRLDGLAEHIGSLAVVRSDDDQLVPAGHTDDLARSLGTESLVVPGAGHFLADEGIVRLPEVLPLAGDRRLRAEA